MILCTLQQISCLTCAPCLEPDFVEGFEAVVQSTAISDTLVAVQIKASKNLAGVQFEMWCTLGKVCGLGLVFYDMVL